MKQRHILDTGHWTGISPKNRQNFPFVVMFPFQVYWNRIYFLLFQAFNSVKMRTFNLEFSFRDSNVIVYCIQ